MSRFTAVITTINVPTLLADLSANAQVNNRDQQVSVIIIADRKTPPEAQRYVDSLSEAKIQIEYFSPEQQEKWLQQYPELDSIVPYNTDNRRNIGHLMAYERGDEITLTIDDDNYPAASDYFGGFDSLGKTEPRKLTSSSSGWYNVCELLDCKPDVKFHPRGFPVSKRFVEESTSTHIAASRLVAQAGLWNGVPDVDASTHVTVELTTMGVPGRNVVLNRRTWCPFNTQNSAYLTEITPAFYYVSMAEPLNGQSVDRYGDIWASYIARTVIDAVRSEQDIPDVIGFGDPLANHIRNAHDFLHDLQLESPAMRLNETLLEILLEIELRGSTNYLDTAAELASELPIAIDKKLAHNRAERDYLLQLAHKFSVWNLVCRKAYTPQ